MEIGEFATYHDNGSMGRIRSTLIAKALTSAKQRDIAGLLSCLEHDGFNGLLTKSLKQNLTGNQLVSMSFNYPINLAKENIYILYTENMIKTFGNIFEIGSWDFQTQTSETKGYALPPFISRNENIINFHGGRINLSKGIITEGDIAVPLLAALIVKDGYVINRIDYKAVQGVYLQILIGQHQNPSLQVMEESVFRSNFNQQFMLGNYDEHYYEEVYNNFPVARLFRVKSIKSN